LKGAKPNLIKRRVELARQGANPHVICRMPSGWLVIGDVQPLPGYCLLLADPVVESLNALNDSERARYSRDVARVGDALLEVTDAYRINYETWGNLEPALHTHITPRYLSEPLFRRRMPPGQSYFRAFARRYDPARDGDFVRRMRAALNPIKLD
jgi:diadenosine tetraphosphate (Ap4A) HIT family hydrolase